MDAFAGGTTVPVRWVTEVALPGVNEQGFEITSEAQQITSVGCRTTL